MKLTKKLLLVLMTLLLVGCSSPQNTSPTPDSPAPETTTNQSTPTDKSPLTEDEIKAIVLAEIPNGTIVKIDSDLNDFIPNYDVTVIENNMEYDFEIDAYTGAIRGTEKELETDSKTLTPPKFSEEDAKAIALQEIPGGEVTSIEYDSDEYAPHYTVSLRFENYEYDIEIDAQTGTIREIEKDLLP